MLENCSDAARTDFVIEVEGVAVVFTVDAQCGDAYPPAVNHRLVELLAKEVKRLLPQLIAEEEARLTQEGKSIEPPAPRRVVTPTAPPMAAHPVGLPIPI